MSLIKNLKSRKAQSILEYLLPFIIVTFAVVAAFGGINLGDSNGNNCTIKLKSVFDNAISNAIDKIKD